MDALKDRVFGLLAELRQESGFGCGSYEQALSDVADRLEKVIGEPACHLCSKQVEGNELICSFCYSDEVESGAIIEETASVEADVAIIGASKGRALAYLCAHGIDTLHDAGVVAMASMLRVAQGHQCKMVTQADLFERLDGLMAYAKMEAA